MQAWIKDSAVMVSAPRSRMDWIRTVAYWVFTLIVAYEMAAGGIWDLLRIEYVRVIMAHLGYPVYILTIIGVWKIPCAVVLLVPRFLRLKEWAYAGAFFNYTGAAASHLLVGDGANKWAAPLVFAGFTLASWALRSPVRRLVEANPSIDRRAVSWLVPIGIAVVMLILAFVTLPKGPPPS
jgi:DoxX-like family